jgi:sugar phosphate isomerase/epimerase
MVAYGVSSMFFHEYTSAEIFSFASRAGLDGVEFWLETPHFWLRDLPVPEVAASMRDHPRISTLYIHAPILDLNPCSINPDVAETSIRYAVRSVGIAEMLGARVLTLHPGRRTAKRPPGSADLARFDRYITALRETVLKNDLRLAMENMEPAVNSLLCTPERMRAVLDAEPWLFFTLDTSHAMVGSKEGVMQYIELCFDRLVDVHVSRADGRRLHLPLDRDPAMARILAALADHHYHGGLMLEIDDLNFSRPLTADEKITILSRDCAFMKECME